MDETQPPPLPPTVPPLPVQETAAPNPAQANLGSLLPKLTASLPKPKLNLIAILTALLLAGILLNSLGYRFYPPKVAVTYPGDNGRDIPLDSQIEIQFDREMQTRSVERAFAISPQTPGVFSWPSRTRLIFTPNNLLEPGKTYTVTIKKWVLSSFFIPKLKPAIFSFTTYGQKHPIVLLATPQNEVDETRPSITVLFDRAMIPLTTIAEKEERLPAFELEPAVEGEGRWLGTTAYQFRPSRPLQPATTYAYRIKAGLKSTDGGELQQDYVYAFSTPRPRLQSLSPARSYKYANPIASVSAVLSLPIDLRSARESFHLFQLPLGATMAQPPNYQDQQNALPGEPVPAQPFAEQDRTEVPVTVKLNNQEVGMHPGRPLERERIYEAQIDAGLLSTAGKNGLETTQTWTLAIAPQPAVTRSNPADKAEMVEEEHQIEVEFASPMAEDSFKGNVFISPEPEREPSLYFSSYQNHFLSIGTYLKRSTNYTIRVSGRVRDQYGVPLGQDYVFSFTTAPFKPSISIVPTETYFASFNQEVVPRIVSKVVNVNRIDYRLYRLTREEFLHLYWLRFITTNYADRDWQAYDPSRLELVRSWPETFETDPDVPIHVITKVEGDNGIKIPSGLYFLDASIGEGRHDNLVMVVSRASLTLKTSPDQAFVWAVDQNSGEVVPEMEIELVSVNNAQLSQGKTNGDGVYSAETTIRPKRQDYINADNPVFAFGRKGDDLTAVSDAWGEGVSPYSFGLERYWDPYESDNYQAEKTLKLYLQLDRPIYRPGQTVYFRGVVREDNDGEYSLLDQSSQVDINVSDSQNQKAFDAKLPLTSYGTFSGSFDLSQEGSVGYYAIKASLLDNGFTQSFQVEEYRRPEFKVEITADQPEYIDGETVKASIEASFYFGSPVDRSPLTWTLSTQDDPYRWPKDQRFEFGDSDSYWYQPWWAFEYNDYYSGKVIGEGTGATDQSGRYQVSFPTNFSDKTANQRLRLEASVEDENSNQVIGASGEFIVHQSGLNVGLKPERYSTQAGAEARVELVVVNINGQEQANIPVAVSLAKRTWNSVKEQNPDDGEFYWVSKPADEAVAEVEVVTGEHGRATAAFVPPAGGTFRVVAKVADHQGKTANSATYLWVSGPGGSSVRRENHDRIVLVPDKQEYQVGETASVYAALPYEQMTGLVTVERGSVFDYQIVKTSADSQTVALPIKNRYSPNAFLSGVFIKPGPTVKDPPQFKMGIAEIRINDPTHRLDLALTPDKDRYAPGETMKATVEVRDGNGTPVQAELALALVDQAVWNLARAELADIQEIFYRPRNLAVFTGQTLTKLMDRINANVSLGAKGGSGGGCFGGETEVLMADGQSKPINQIAANDLILTRESEASPRLTAARVNKVAVHDVDSYYLINQEFRVTGVHRLYSRQGWQTVADLAVGDQLLRPDNTWLEIENIALINDPIRVYNLEVDRYHTFVAGGVWAHNQKGGPITTREKFFDTAYWNAHLETNEAGKTEVSIELPDNLTTWNLIGVGVTKATAVGSLVQEVLVTKDVLIQPLLPRFLSNGDEPRLGMTIHNNTSQPQRVEAGIETDGITISEVKTKSLMIAANTAKSVYWQGVVANVSEATIRLTAQGSNELTDQLKLTLPVVSYFTPEVTATSGEAADVGQETIYLPKDIVPDQGGLDLRLSPSLGAGVQNATDYIVDFPYSCNEQKAGRITAVVQLLRLADQAGLETIGGYHRDNLHDQVVNSVQGVLNAQRPDGGWGWWQGSFESSPFVSAMVLDSLLTARENGYLAAAAAIDRSTKYLASNLAADQTPVNLQAYLAQTLARMKAVDKGDLNRLMDRRWEMSVLGRAYLLRALQEAAGPRRDRDRLMDEIVSLAEKTNTTVHWEDQKSEWQLMGSGVTVTSVMLEALVRQNTNQPLIPEITRWLLQARTGNHWQSTHETTAAIQAVVAMMLARSEGKINENWSVDLDHSKLIEGAFGRSDLLRQVEKTVALGDLAKEKEIPIRIQKSGQGSLYYNLNLQYFLPFEEVEPVDQGVVIIRELVDRNGRVLDAGRVSTSSEIWVRLILILPATRHHLVIEDTLPAGLEPVNESLATTALLNVERLKIPEDRQPLYFRHQEMRDDRVVLFAETVPAGVYEYTYRARPTTPGRYHYPPARAYNMYLPDISGHSAGGWLAVEAE